MKLMLVKLFDAAKCTEYHQHSRPKCAISSERERPTNIKLGIQMKYEDLYH